MNQGKAIFSQITETLDPKQLSRCVKRYSMPRGSRRFSAMDQFLCMVFAQLTLRESMRDIESCLRGLKIPFGASGLFGNDLPDHWKSHAEVLEEINAYWSLTDRDENVHGWYDLHARLG